MNLNKRHIRKISFKIILFIICSQFYSPDKIDAQYNDAQLWENIEVSKNVTRNTTLHINHEGRISNNISIFHYAYLDFGITHTLIKHLRASADYVLVWKQTDTRTSWRHQWYVDLQYKQKFLKHFDVYLRSMYQQQYQDLYSSDLGHYPENYFRNKITLKYSFFKYPLYKLQPYIACESYYHMDNNTKYGAEFDRTRYFAGMFYSFNKSNELELYYMIEKNFNINDPPTNYVIGIGYSLEL